MSFKVGDVVKLKSGEPKMTIERIDSDESALCAWFDNKSERQKAMFSLATLERGGASVQGTPSGPAPRTGAWS
jgi:uncharacterized protein YodC (DUF2158 family)